MRAREFIIETMKHTVLKEGGNVFAGKTTSIKRENIGPTLDRYFAELKDIFPKKAKIFNDKNFVPLGSVGKKAVSGDIDLGVSATDILDEEMSDTSIADWGIDPSEVTKQQEVLAKRARTARPEELRLKAFFQLLAIKINNSAGDLYVDEKKVTPGNIFGLFPQYDSEGNNLDTGVQIDWMVGNLDWLTFSYYSSAYPETSNVKGLHRTQLMLSAFQVANLSFGHVKGVTDKETGEVVATNSKDALKLLNSRLGTKIDSTTAENYYTLHEALKAQLSSENYDKLIAIYLKILDSTRADIPDDLQSTWIKRKDELGLKGKFLPDNSKLLKYQQLSESGVAGAARVASRADFKKFLLDYEKLISQFPGYQSMEPTGSYQSDLSKNDFGDIDLVIHIDSDKDKAQVKKDLMQFMQAQPETLIVPFSSEKHAGKRSYNAGELVSVRFHSDSVGDSAQIDNIIALSSSEATYKKAFLNYEASKQGLMLGLVKIATIETDPAKLFQHLGIKVNPALEKDQEWEFNLSPVELQLRKVQYEPGTYKQANREIVWSSRDMNDLNKLLYQYDLTASFDDLLQQAQSKVKNPRSGNRIKGVFKTMITVKSGEVGTPKGEKKIEATKKIEKAFP